MIVLHMYNVIHVGTWDIITFGLFVFGRQEIGTKKNPAEAGLEVGSG